MPSKKNLQSNLGSKIAAFVLSKRMESGIVQTHMAKELDVDQSCYSKLEKGYRDFTLSELEVVANIFEMSLPEFFLKAFAGDGNILPVLQECLSTMNQSKTAERLRRELVTTGGRFASTQMLLEIMYQTPNINVAI
jgi:transcriptional regulator with XRE-family HTH domain